MSTSGSSACSSYWVWRAASRARGRPWRSECGSASGWPRHPSSKTPAPTLRPTGRTVVVGTRLLFAALGFPAGVPIPAGFALVAAFFNAAFWPVPRLRALPAAAPLGPSTLSGNPRAARPWRVPDPTCVGFGLCCQFLRLADQHRLPLTLEIVTGLTCWLFAHAIVLAMSAPETSAISRLGPQRLPNTRTMTFMARTTPSGAPRAARYEASPQRPRRLLQGKGRRRLLVFSHRLASPPR